LQLKKLNSTQLNSTQLNSKAKNMFFTNRIDAEEKARDLSSWRPNEYQIAVFHSQVYQWLVTSPTGAKAIFDGGYGFKSQATAFLQGSQSTIDEAISGEIDLAYVSHKKHKRGFLFARTWIDQLAAARGYTVFQDGSKLYVERPSGTFFDVFNIATADNYKPTKTLY
jgi:hypothetical protein